MNQRQIEKEIELAKIQIYAEQRHTVVSIMASAIFGVLVSFAVVFYGLFFQGNISNLTFGISLTVLYALSFTYILNIIVGYRGDLKRISDMIETIKEGKELPKLNEFSDWNKQEEKSGEKNPRLTRS